MSIKSMVKDWLGVSSADKICQDCGASGANKVTSPFHKGRIIGYDYGRGMVTDILCYKCSLIQKQEIVNNIEQAEKGMKKRRDQINLKYVIAKDFFKSRGD